MAPRGRAEPTGGRTRDWGLDAMRHQNSVFPRLLKRLLWGEFDRRHYHGDDDRLLETEPATQFNSLQLALQ